LRGELEEVIDSIRTKAEGINNSDFDSPPNIRGFSAINHMLGTGNADSTQSAILLSAQQALSKLYGKGNYTQQQIDEIIADTCTRLLNETNAPSKKEDGAQQTVIPAYTNAINSLLLRLRKDTEESIHKRKSISLSEPYYAERYWGEMLDFFTRNFETGDLNFRNPAVWDEMIQAYSPEAKALDGSQYLFVYNGDIMSSEDLGNLVYGYYWTGFGIPADVLYLGAGVVAVAHDVMDDDPSTSPNLGNGFWGDDASDRAAIDKGIEMFLEGN